MARKLSRLAQCGRLLLLVGLWLPLAASAPGDEGVRVAPTARTVNNPFAAQVAARPNVPASPEPPQSGPRTYQNPFAARDAAQPPIVPLGPGPLSRWRQSVPQRPLDTAPAQDPNQPANPFSGRAAAVDPPSDVLVPESLAQPSWVLPSESPEPEPTGQPQSADGDPFDAAEPVEDVPNDGIQFAPSSRPAAKAAGLNRAFGLEESESDALSPVDGRAWFAEAQRAAQTATTADELSNVVELCRRAAAADVPREDRQSLRQLTAWAMNRRGELAIGAGRGEAAMEDFQAAIELDPNCWLALHNRGVSYAQQHLISEALGDFNRAIALNPGLAVAYRNRGELLGSMDRTEEAVRDYTQAISQLPNDAELYAMRGHAWHRLGQYDEALADLSHSIKLAPDRPEAYAHRGNVRAEQGDFVAAIRDFRQALRLDPNCVEAYRSMAWLLATCPNSAVRNPQQALAAARQAAQLAGPDDCYVLDALAAAYASAGNFDSAMRCQQQAVAAASQEALPSFQQRLGLYQQRQPYRNDPPTSAVQTAVYEEPYERP